MKGMMRISRAMAIGVGLAGPSLMLLAGSVPAAADEVKMYSAPPSVEELERSLGTGERPKVGKRSIVFGEEGAAAPAAQQPAAPPPPQTYQPPQQQSYQPQQQEQQTYQPPQQQQTYQPPQQQAAASSGKAVGMPINFDMGSAQIRPESVPFLDSIGGLLNKDPSLRLLIEGHTDAIGSFSSNMSLSRARAQSVMNFLVTRYGIQPQRLQAVGKGPTEPLTPASPTSPQNRRVQFRALVG